MAALEAGRGPGGLAADRRRRELLRNRFLIRPWNQFHRIVLYRRKVTLETRRNFPLDLFDPACGDYEYSAIVSNKQMSGRTLWHLYNGRGCQKDLRRTPRRLRLRLRPQPARAGKRAWQALGVLAFNLARAFQADTLAPARNTNRKRRTRRRFETIHTLRFKLLGRAAVLLRPAGKATLQLGRSNAVASHFLAVANAIRA